MDSHVQLVLGFERDEDRVDNCAWDSSSRMIVRIVIHKPLRRSRQAIEERFGRHLWWEREGKLEHRTSWMHGGIEVIDNPVG